MCFSQCIKIIRYPELGCRRSGYFGDQCTLSCPTNCKEDRCHINTGYCFECLPGFKGQSCNEGMLLRGHYMYILIMHCLIKSVIALRIQTIISKLVCKNTSGVGTVVKHLLILY